MRGKRTVDPVDKAKMESLLREREQAGEPEDEERLKTLLEFIQFGKDVDLTKEEAASFHNFVADS